MHYTISPEDMKLLETAYMKEYGVPGALLMEHAAQGVVAAMLRRVPQSARALFLCGPGNNGGDGYAAARLWQAQGGHAMIWEMTDTPAGDAGTNRRLALDAGVRLTVPDAINDCHIIVDALFGTGLARPVTGVAGEMIAVANCSGLPIIAVDIPSGLDGTTGRAPGNAVRATETVTFHRIKTGLLLRDAPAYTGSITVHPILIPQDYGAAPGLAYMDEQDVAREAGRSSLPPTAHKGDMGTVLIFAGSPGMAGAAAMCARAAIRCGAGLTQLLLQDASMLPILQALVPEATCTVLPEDPAEAADAARAQLQRADAAVIGPGLGQKDSLLPLLREFARADLPVVWDADALNLLSAHPELLPLRHDAVATPHPGEAARLLGCTTQHITGDPLRALKQLHGVLGCFVMLKGARSLMTDGEKTCVNFSGSPLMAQGGSGDTLCGILAALLARNNINYILNTMQLAAAIHQLDFQPERAPHIS